MVDVGCGGNALKMGHFLMTFLWVEVSNEKCILFHTENVYNKLLIIFIMHFKYIFEHLVNGKP